MTEALATSAPAPDAYVDRKKALWLLSVVAPAGSLLGPLAYLLGFTDPLWFFVPLLLFYGGVPLMDAILGEDLSNPPEAAVPRLEQDPYYRWINYAVVPVLWGTFLFNMVFLATHQLPWYAWLAAALGSGSMMGFGLTLCHELGHKTDWLNRKIALFTSALGAYGHFSIEHNRGHHRHVATPEDPASARMGENIYRFALRELPGAFVRAWALEASRLERAGKSRWSVGNEILQAGAFTVVLYSGLVLAVGVQVLPLLAVVALWGAFQLTSANYVEHYGLLRMKNAAGRYEPCQPHHSWNSNHVASNLMLFHLERHSDHHANPSRSYQSLRNFPELPTLPSGYFGMFVAAYIPPLWYALMDKRLVQTTHGAVERINFQPARRDALIRKFGLQPQA